MEITKSGSEAYVILLTSLFVVSLIYACFLTAEPNADTSANKSRAREKKEPFRIDFLTPSTRSQKEISKEIFAPVTRGGSITLPQFGKSKRGKKGSKEKRSEQTLPADMHFSSRQLVTLFLKPKLAVSLIGRNFSLFSEFDCSIFNVQLKMRGSRARLDRNDGEVDENFWAQAAADQAAGRQAEDGEDGQFTPDFLF